MNGQTLELYTDIHRGAKMSIAGLDMLIRASSDEAYKNYLVHKQNRYKQIAAKAGQSLQEYSEFAEGDPGVIPLLATQTTASLTSLMGQARQEEPTRVMLGSFRSSSQDLADSMQKNADAALSARNLAFSLLELQQNDLYNFSAGIRQ
jgi:hypothetical protein